jgi:hypothetical protein
MKFGGENRGVKGENFVLGCKPAGGGVTGGDTDFFEKLKKHFGCATPPKI